MNKSELSEKIRQIAIELGFVACGFSKPIILTKDKEKLIDNIQRGFHAEMKYLENNIEKRADPELHLNDVKSVISVLLSYVPSDVNVNSDYHVSAYAVGNDYHKIMTSLLEKFVFRIKELVPDVMAKYYCDSSPIFERALAVKGGLGWIGKNALLINPKFGSFVFIGELLTDIEMEFDGSLEEQCGNCNLCIDACPTSAIIEPYTIDARKCITYHTVEKRPDSPSVELLANFGNHIYGCDACQTICPYNKGVDLTKNIFFHPNEYVFWNNEQWESVDEGTFSKVFAETAIKRIGLDGLKRNLSYIKKHDSR
jgi:epoxyqueuosine reductase